MFVNILTSVNTVTFQEPQKYKRDSSRNILDHESESENVLIPEEIAYVLTAKTLRNIDIEIH